MIFLSQMHINQDTYGPALSVQMHLGIEHFMQVSKQGVTCEKNQVTTSRTQKMGVLAQQLKNCCIEFAKMLSGDVQPDFASLDDVKRRGCFSKKSCLRSFFAFFGHFRACFKPKFFQTPWVIEWTHFTPFVGRKNFEPYFLSPLCPKNVFFSSFLLRLAPTVIPGWSLLYYPSFISFPHVFPYQR